MVTEICNDITQFVLWHNNLPAHIHQACHTMSRRVMYGITQFVLWCNNLPACINDVSHVSAVVKLTTTCQGVSGECHVWINTRHVKAKNTP